MSTALAPALFDQVEEALKDVMDPELGVNIVDLGLIYDLSWDPENDALIISMTLTSAGCPLTDVIEEQTAQSLDGVVDAFGVEFDAKVNVVVDDERRIVATADLQQRAGLFLAQRCVGGLVAVLHQRRAALDRLFGRADQLVRVIPVGGHDVQTVQGPLSGFTHFFSPKNNGTRLGMRCPSAIA